MKRTVLAALLLTFGLSLRAAESPGNFAPTAPRLSRAQIEAAGLHSRADRPEGYYVSANGDLTLRITKSGLVRADFGVLLTNGSKANLSFPNRLRYHAHQEYWRTSGEMSVSYWSNIGMLTCRHSVGLIVEDVRGGDELRVTFRLPAQLGLDTLGRCLDWGTRETRVRFYRE